MKILIINGNPDNHNSDFDFYLSRLADLLKSKGDNPELIALKEMNIRYCAGCYGCMVKTPGACLFKDDAEMIERSYMNSEFVILASPIIMGFTSALLKRVQERLIPLVMPYFVASGNELHHMRRYKKYPDIGVILQKEAATEADDIKIIESIYERMAITAFAKLSFVKLTHETIEDVADAINHL